VISYTLPSYSDPEVQAITLQTFRPMQTTLPAFVTFSSNKFRVAPKLTSQVGLHTIQVDLIDTMKASSSYSFNVLVNAPAVTTATSGSVSSDATTTTIAASSSATSSA
jgi:hypothetical protein